MPDHAELEPTPALLAELPVILERLRGRGLSGEVLDLACGSGRNALALARAGLPAAACDRDEAALARLRERAAAEALTVRAFSLDLEAAPEPLGEARFAGIVVTRYLHRPLMAHLRACVEPGGFVFYETFRRAQAAWGRPSNPEFLLEDGELASAFAGWEIERSWEGLIEAPRKQALARVLAWKPGDLRRV